MRWSSVVLPVVVTGALLAVYVPITHQLVQVSKHLPSVAAASAAAAPTVTKVSAPPTTPIQAPVPASGSRAAAQTPTPPACSPVAFGLPSGLDMAGSTAGLHTQIDPPTYYRIYGVTATQLRTQIQQCAPGAQGSASAEFTAQTDYNLTWSYDYTGNGSNCSISNVRVGMHVAMALPSWTDPGASTNGLAGRWQTFASALTAHESGHVALDLQYAALLQNDLEAVGSVSCANITTVVHNLANRDITLLNQANSAYDAQTNHGATQGAVLPTY